MNELIIKNMKETIKKVSEKEQNDFLDNLSKNLYLEIKEKVFYSTGIKTLSEDLPKLKILEVCNEIEKMILNNEYNSEIEDIKINKFTNSKFRIDELFEKNLIWNSYNIKYKEVGYSIYAIIDCHYNEIIFQVNSGLEWEISEKLIASAKEKYIENEICKNCKYYKDITVLNEFDDNYSRGIYLGSQIFKKGIKIETIGGLEFSCKQDCKFTPNSTSRKEELFDHLFISEIEKYGIEIKRQFPIANKRNATYLLDFYIPEAQLIIEYDEEYHKNQMEKDIDRMNEVIEHLKLLGLNPKVIRVKEGQEEKGIKEIKEYLIEKNLIKNTAS